MDGQRQTDLRRLGGLRRLLRDRRGGVMITMALAIIPLCVVIGLAIDTARGLLVKSKLSYALDAAGLAGGRVFDERRRDDDIRMFFRANFPPGYMDAEIAGGGPTIVADEANATLTVTAAATIPTSLMAVVGLRELTVSARTVIARRGKPIELALVMDTTGSMRSGGKIDAMKAAARDLIGILYGDREEVASLRVGVVPYAATVNVGGERAGWLTGYDPDDFRPTNWKGCVEARDHPHDSDDAPPSVARWRPFLWRSTKGMYWSDGSYGPDAGGGSATVLVGDNEWDPDGPESALKDANEDQNEGTGPNLGCATAITPLTRSRSEIVAAIDAMQPWHRGGTMANLGLAWGWRVLSPRWRGEWGDPERPRDYGADGGAKVIILLTDGENQWYDWPGSGSREGGLPGDNSYRSKSGTYKNLFPGADYTAYGRLNEGRLGTTNNTNANKVIDDRMLELCSSIKDRSIILYTITFQVSNGSTRKLYEDCAASRRHYFDSPTNSELREVFTEIAQELTKLRIAE